MIWDNNDLHIVIDHPSRDAEDDKLFRKIIFESEVINIVPRGTSLLDILVESGFFKSKNEARKNWSRGEMVSGMNRFERIGKMKRNLYILNLPDDFPCALSA